MTYFKHDLSQLEVRQKYLLLNNLIVPRPIAWVSTINNGITNIAPFSFFNAVCSDPTLVMISFGYRDDGIKDSLRNIMQTKELVINIADQSFFDQMVDSAAEFKVSEIDALGIKTMPSELVSAPRVADVPVQFECTLYKTIELGVAPEGSVVVFAEVKLIHVKEDILNQGKVDYLKYDPIARLGGISYGKINEVIKKVIPEPKS